jgi:hypothetical protein
MPEKSVILRMAAAICRRMMVLFSVRPRQDHPSSASTLDEE